MLVGGAAVLIISLLHADVQMDQSWDANIWYVFLSYQNYSNLIDNLNSGNIHRWRNISGIYLWIKNKQENHESSWKIQDTEISRSVFVNTCSTGNLLGPVVLLLLYTWTIAFSMYTCNVELGTSLASLVNTKSQNLLSKPKLNHQLNSTEFEVRQRTTPPHTPQTLCCCC